MAMLVQPACCCIPPRQLLSTRSDGAKQSWPPSRPAAVLPKTIPTANPSLYQEITCLCTSGGLNDALRLLLSSDPASHADAIGALVAACSSAGELGIGRRLHQLISSSPQLMGNRFLTTRLLTMYSTCGSPSDARRFFKSLPHRNLFQWNAMISGYARNKLWDESLSLFSQLLSDSDLKPDNFTLPCVLKSCAGLSDVEVGKTVHGVAMKMSLSSDVYVCNSLISMYGKCGCIDEAVLVFEVMPDRNLVSWNTLMCELSENGLVQRGFDLFGEMMVAGEGCNAPDDATLVTVLPMCAGEGWLEMGRLVHGFSVKLSLARELRISNALIDMYAKCGCLVESWHLFHKAPERNVVSWNAMIAGFARNGDVDEAFGLLREMWLVDGLKADEITVLNVLPACLEPSELLNVKELHGYVIRNRLEGNDLVPNSLIAAYAKCGSLESAEHVFDGTVIKTVSLWNAIIGGYAQNGDSKRAIGLFLQMTSSGLEPDWFSIGSVLLACTNLKYLQHGRSIHGFVQRNGLEKDSFIRVSLISFYVQCGEALAARVLFDAMEEKDLVSWNAIIAGHSQNGLPEESLHLFCQMQQDGYSPYTIATMSALMACAQLSALRLGKEMHCFALKANYSEDVFVGSSIIDMYAKCGSIKQSRDFFERMEDKDVVSWTVMIMGYGIHGCGYESVELFDRMQREGLKPDAFTFLGILVACCHSGFVEEGLKYFDEMRKKHGVEPKLEHYACVADMLGRSGNVADAARLIKEMPGEADGRMWGALLGACRIHGDISLGEKVAAKLLELEPDKAEHYVLASNLFAESGRWDDVRRLRKKLKESGLRKEPGCSWVNLGGKVYKFMVGDNRHPDSDEVSRMWGVLEEKIRRIGYVPDTGSVLHELEEEEKVEVLRGHSEKQAISFGLLRMSGGTKVIRVYKNIRMCRDCHSAAKLVSKVSKREIVVRDNKRFHHFRDGSCSCADYW